MKGIETVFFKKLYVNCYKFSLITDHERKLLPPEILGL